jgi:hypothetical protein
VDDVAFLAGEDLVGGQDVAGGIDLAVVRVVDDRLVVRVARSRPVERERLARADES